MSTVPGRFSEKGINYIDVGTSGGVFGLDRGYSLMVGGPADAVAEMAPIFTDLAPGPGEIVRTPVYKGDPVPAELGWLHCGPNGAGHFVKMVHNGIEYGMMAALAEGLNILSEGKRRLRRSAEGRRDRAADASRVLPVRLRPRGHHRAVATRQRDLQLARRSRGCGAWVRTRS